jgi:hypothetical protein
MAAKRKGGKPWTEEQYREAGIELIHLRLKREDHVPLDELVKAWGLEGSRAPRGEAIKRAIAEAHAKHVARPMRLNQLVEQPPDESGTLTKPPLNNRTGGQKSDNSKKKAT